MSKAPEPDQIVWENLEVTQKRKWYLRTRTGLITAGLVIICFVIILQASIYKQKFSSKIPSSDLCKNTVPELYNSQASTLSSTDVSHYDLYRPPSSKVKDYDKSCANVVKETFYAVYSEKSKEFCCFNRITLHRCADFSAPVVHYDIAACYNTTAHSKDMCPTLGQSSYCPCVSIVDSSKCSSAECTGNKAVGMLQ